MITFINTNINRDDVANIKSTHISTFLQSNNATELKKIYDFYASNQKLLLLTGFGGTGKRLVIDHSLGFLAPNVVRLEYDCKSATVCDDILLNFINVMQSTPDIKKIISPKIENFVKTLNRYLSISRAPILIFINGIDNVQETNLNLILDFLFSTLEYKNVKLVITGKTFDSCNVPVKFDFEKIISKPLNKQIFAQYITSKNIEANDGELNELYRLTRGYYYYTKLLSSLLTSSNTSAKEFINKCKNSGKIFDKYLCDFAISTLSIPIRNFFWFLLLLRHGISYDALSVFDLYDEMSIKHLLQAGYIYETNGVIYVSDYFHSDVEIIIPKNIKQKLHKYLVDMYKNQLQETPEKRVLKLSRQSLHAEIDYHTMYSESDFEQVNNILPAPIIPKIEEKVEPVVVEPVIKEESVDDILISATNYLNSFKYTECIETYYKALNKLTDIRKKIDVFVSLAKVYTKISEWSKSIHYYNLAKEFFENNKEPININYIKYEIADVYYNTYNINEARKILKEVIYSQDSPQALMIDACLRLGNYEDASGNYENAYAYYKQGIDSIDETTNELTLQELYFRYAVTLDESGQKDLAIKYYNEYLNTSAEDFRSPVLCNLGTLYEENGNLDLAEKYFVEAYNFDLGKNNYDGIYYSAIHLANIYFSSSPKKSYQYIKMAKNSAEMLNDIFYIAQAHLLTGDYYYRTNKNEEALKEYITVYMSVKEEFSKENLKKVTDRIRDMELRLGEEKYTEIMKNYAK